VITALKFGVMLLLVLANGFFVAAEFAIVKVRGTKVQSLARKGSRRARMVQHLIEHLNEYLSACQLGITIASILLGWVGEATMRDAIVEPVLRRLAVTSEYVIRTVSFLFGTGLIVFLHVVIGELAPKTLAIQKAEATALWVAYPMRWFYVLMYPFIAALNNSANYFLKLIGIKVEPGSETAHSEEEMRLIFAESERSGVLTPDKLDLLENVIDLSRRVVRQIMVPRTEVYAFDVRKPLGENLHTAESSAHSRYPLIDGDLDHVIGVIHMKDLFWQLKDMEAPPESADALAAQRNPMIAGGDMPSHPPASGAQFLRAIAREVLFIPETMRTDILMREFQQKRIHLAVVVDEYGGTSGLVTFEDCIEEIVGEVQDEFDEETPMIRQTGEREWTLDGGTPLNEVNDALGTDFHAEEIDTVGGFVLSELGRIPKTGDSLRADGVLLTVREMRQQRIHRIVAQIEEPPSSESEE
jgi:CBS domain containing-hemolysin-like protein